MTIWEPRRPGESRSRQTAREFAAWIEAIAICMIGWFLLVVALAGEGR